MKLDKNIIIGVVLLLGLGGWYVISQRGQEATPVPNSESPTVQPSPTPTPEGPRVFEVSVKDRKLLPEIVTVFQGDEVLLRVTTDEEGEFHVAGYEIKKEMDLNGVTEVSFTADKPGRYNFELHPPAAEAEHEEGEEDIVIGAFVVNPR